MDPIIQPSISLMTNTECQPAANSPQPEQPFNEVLLKQYAIVEKSTDPKVECQPAANSSQPEQPSNEVPLKQHAIGEKSTDPKEKIADETIPLNFLPILPTQLSQNKSNSLDPMKANLLSQASNQEESINQNQDLPLILSLLEGFGNLEKNTLSSTPGQGKSDPSASESFGVRDLPNILDSKEGLLQAGLLSKDVQIPANEGNLQDPKNLDQLARIVDLKNIQWERNGSLLDHQPNISAKIIPVPSQLGDRAIQPEGTSPKSELNPNLLNQKEAIIAQSQLSSAGLFENDANFSSTENVLKVIFDGKDQPAQDPQVTNGLPGEQKKPIGVGETGFYQELWPAQKEHLDSYQRMDGKVIWPIGNSGETKDASPKAGSNVGFLEKNSPIPSLDTNSPLLLEFDEKLDILLGQNSKGEELPGRSLNGEFSGLGNSSAEKNSLKVISGGENHPTQDPFGVNELLGSPKPPIGVEETGTHQKPQLSKTENLDLSQQIAEKVIWSIRNKEEKIRLTLDPPQLGNLFIELHRDKEEIKATLWADNPKTKEILENNQFQLQKTLEGHGFKLEKYDVFLQNDMGSFQGKEEKPVFQGQGGRTQSLQIEQAELPPSLEIHPGAIPGAWGSKYVDRFI
jgi:hypothetical protein